MKKTIAVLTDLSPGSEHAAIYALHLAKKLKADVMLYNLDPVPAVGKLALASGFSDNDEQDLMVNINDRAEALCDRLERQIIEKSFPGSPLPEITYDEGNGEVVDVMTSVVNNDSIILIVIAPRNGQDMATCMLSDHCRQVTHWATVPVMIVPGTTPIRNPEKIAITASLDEHDTDYVTALANLAEQFSPEIMVAHLTETISPESSFTIAEKKLMANLYKMVDYGRVYYRRINVGGREKGWKWLNANKKCDMLVIRHQPQSALKEFFGLGHTPQVTHHITIPIVVLPDMN